MREHPMKVGDHVRARDAGKEWNKGQVTQTEPTLEVLLDSRHYTDPYTWDEVQHRNICKRCKRCNSDLHDGQEIVRCPSCSWWTCKKCSIAESALWEQAYGAEKFTEVKDAKKACAKTQQEIDTQESKLEQAMQQRKFEGGGGAGEIQRSIDDLERRLAAEKATTTAQSKTATKAIADLAKQWASFNTTVNEQKEQTETGMETAKDESTPKSLARLPDLQMHLDRVQKAKHEAKTLKAQADKAKTTGAYFGAVQKLEQLRLSIAGGPKTEEELAKQPIDFGILSQRMDRDHVPNRGADKFVVGKLTTGRPEEAAHGLAAYMGIDDNRLGQIMQGGLKAIRQEFEENGDESDVKIMEYILDEVAVVEEEVVSYGTVMRDEGHDNMRLEDFRMLKDAVTAQLKPQHVAALRLYTSQAYKRINDPLRNGEKPHPFAATTYFLSEALKKLRAVNAQGTETQQRKEFWRGMKVRVDHHRPCGG
jgi:hypothetical protein